MRYPPDSSLRAGPRSPGFPWSEPSAAEFTGRRWLHCLVSSTTRPLLRRPDDGRLVAGVCQGIAAHLGFDVRWVRFFTVMLVPAWGIGAVVYAFLWATVPEGDPYAGRPRPAGLERLAARQRHSVRQSALPWLIAATGAIVAAVVLGLSRIWLSLDPTLWLPLVSLVVGVAMLWTELDEPVGRAATIARITVGALLAFTGLVFLVWRRSPTQDSLRELLLALAIVAGVLVICAPWLFKAFRTFASERAVRARETERANIAAHLHDSVLQSLALIRAHAESPDEVARIARRQERELREWLYVDRNAPGTSVASELKTVAAQVEDDYATAIDPVIVGDAVPSTASAEVVAAVAEALKNAVRHGRPPVSLYVEFTGRGDKSAVDAYIRDQGAGFDMAEIPADRFGVRESILGRIKRAGGTATIDMRPGRGTEVHIHLPLGKRKSEANV